MRDKECNICGFNDFEIKNVYLQTKSFFLKNELYYVRTCKCCGKTDFFSAKIVDKKGCKNFKKY